MRKINSKVALLLAFFMLVSVLPSVAWAGQENADISPMSLQPLEEIGSSSRPIEIDLSDIDSEMLSAVPVATVLERLNAALADTRWSDKTVDVETSTVAWVKRYSSLYSGSDDDYELPINGTMDLTPGYTLTEINQAVADHTLSRDEAYDLRCYYTNDPCYAYLLLIVGDNANDQTNPDSTRFIVKALLHRNNRIMDISLTNADEGANDEEIKIIDTYYYTDAYSDEINIDIYNIYIPGSFDGNSIDVKMNIKDALKDKYSDLKIYKGFVSSPEDAETDALANNAYTAEFTGGWFDEMFTAFYNDSLQREQSYYYEVYIETTRISIGYDYIKDENGKRIYSSNYSSEIVDGAYIEVHTFKLPYGSEIGNEYTLKMGSNNPEYPENIDVDNIKAAYLGLYLTAESAEGQTDIKDALFTDGYTSDQFDEGLIFTVIDNNDEISYYKYYVAVGEYVEPELEEGMDFQITSVSKTETDYELYDTFTSNARIKTDTMKTIYQTIFILDTEENIKANAGGKIYPLWYTSLNAKVAWADGDEAATERTSGTPMEFKPGEPKLITVTAENGSVTNYYVTFIAQKPEAELYVLGENVKDNNFDETLNIPGREVHLGDFECSETYYDIMFANIGATPLTDISVSWKDGIHENVDIDEYWTVGETSQLGAFDAVTSGRYLNYGFLGNVGKIRLVPTYDENGRIRHGSINGILVIKAGDKTVEIKITGISGIPKIITETLEDKNAVKWVPYGIVIQSNNVSDTDVTFEIDTHGGVLPAGIGLRSGGALYGVPTSMPGEYSFGVDLVYRDKNNIRTVIDHKDYTLKVEDNTDEAVWNETDENYDIIQYVGTEYGEHHFVINSIRNQVFTSNGDFGEFVAFYLDGVKLTEGVDYSARSGSTIITIYDETIEGTEDGETHTIAAEFRNDGTTADEDPKNEIKRAAQNYTIDLPSNDDDDYPPADPVVPVKPTKPVDSDKKKDFSFTDVEKDRWYYDDVRWAFEKDWMVGISDKEFAPEQPVSQAIIVTVLARMQGIDLSKYENVTDAGIPAGKWYTTAAIWAKQAGLLPTEEFTEDAVTPRGQMAVMLVKYLRSMGVDVSAPSEPYVFADADDMTEAENAAFQALYKLNIFKGVGGMYMAPQSSTRRCEFVALIHRISDLKNSLT